MTAREYVIKASYGNDSIALIQWMADHGHTNAFVLYNDTGWARGDARVRAGVDFDRTLPASGGWLERVAEGEAFARSLGMEPVRTASMGFVAAARLKQAFPSGGMQFCTTLLKIKPTLEWLEHVDTDGDLDVAVGVRREESDARADFPEVVVRSLADGYRDLWAPMVRVLVPERNDLLRRAGFEVLPHRSDECFPCVRAARQDLRRIAEDEERKAVIRWLEAFLSEGKAKKRRMFRRQGGIDETLRWAQSAPRSYVEGQEFLFGCDAGWCGL